MSKKEINFPKWMQELEPGNKVIVEICKQKKVARKFFPTCIFPNHERLYGIDKSPYEMKFRGWIVAIDKDQILVQIKLPYPNEHMEIPVLIYSSERKQELLEGGKLVRGVYSLPAGVFWTMTLKSNKFLVIQRKLNKKAAEAEQASKN